MMGTVDVSSCHVEILNFRQANPQTNPFSQIRDITQCSLVPGKKCFCSVLHAWIQNLYLTQFHGNLKYFHVEVILVNIYVFLISFPLLCICKIPCIVVLNYTVI